MQAVSVTRTPSSRATIAAGTRPPRVIAITALNGPTSFSRQVSARQSLWNWSQETGKALPARSCALSSGCSAIFIVSVVRFYLNDPALTKYVQIRQHLLDRVHGGLQLFGIAGADHEIGIRLLVLILERVAADDGVRMSIGDFAQGAADVAFPRVGANRVRQHPHAGFQLRRHDVHHC